MKPNFTVEVENENNFTDTSSDAIEFSLDESSLTHLQTLLSDLYSNRKLATLRELSTNAYDAQIESGHEGPIHISLPTTMNPTLIVQDFGVGMDKDDFVNIYTKYAASTKRETQDQVGTLGLGSKAPLALVDSFSVKSVKNGVLTSAVVFRNPRNIGEMHIVHTEPTDAHSGTTISIPIDVDDVKDFQQLAEEFFQFWPAGSVLVDGAQPKFLKGEKLSDEFFIAHNITKDYLVMGNIPYRVEIPSELIPRNGGYYWRDQGGLLPEPPYDKKFGIVMFAPMGSVDFTPSREALNYTKRTTGLLLKAREEGFPTALDAYYKTQLSAQPTKVDAFKFYVKWLENNFDFKPSRNWNGYTIPDKFRISGYLWSNIYKENRGWGGWKMDDFDHFAKNEFETLPETLIVTGYNSVNRPAAPLKRKVKAWLEMNDLAEKVTYVLFTHSDADFDGWHEPYTVTLDEVRKIKLPEQGVGGSTTSGGPRKWETITYKMSDSGTVFRDEGLATSDELVDAETIYLSPSEVHVDSRYSLTMSLATISSDPTRLKVVFVRKNQTKTFITENPSAVHYQEWAKQRAEEITATPYTYAERLNWHSSWRDREVLTMNPEKVNDPELAAYIRTIQEVFGDEGKTDFSRLDKLRVFDRFFDVEIQEPKVIVSPLKKYPLVEHIDLRDATSSTHRKAAAALYDHLNHYYENFLLPDEQNS